jgi:hypothetical protein
MVTSGGSGKRPAPSDVVAVLTGSDAVAALVSMVMVAPFSWVEVEVEDVCFGEAVDLD